MTSNAYAVIMAGGKGERFWPLSTSKHPKQVLSLVGGKPMLALAVDRLKGFIPPSRILVITSADLVAVTAKTLKTLPKENIIGEPFGRDTAAACALASAIVKSRSRNASFCILTADHIIKDIKNFQQVLKDGFELANSADVLVTIGMKPSFPSTGFGYIDAGKKITRKSKTVFQSAKRFVEKPDRKRAEKYIAAGNFFWNSGMFIWSVASIQRAFGKYRPELLAMANSMEKVAGTGRFQKQMAIEYGKLEKISIDYAVMEKSKNIIMARATFDWDDVGSWTALENHFKKDANGNVCIGICETLDSSSNIVMAGNRLTALMGVKDLVVVQAEDVTLVCSRESAQNVKQMVQHLRQNKRYKSVL